MIKKLEKIINDNAAKQKADKHCCNYDISYSLLFFYQFNFLN